MRRAALLLVACAACGGDDGAPPGPVDYPAADVPATTTPEPGVRRELVVVDGVAAPGTPAALNATHVLRYRTDVATPAPADAVVIAFPGFLGGAGSFDGLARDLVLGGADRDLTIEVWAIDRRANLLEDRAGVDTAEASGDPEIANGYYYGDDTIAGAAFDGFVRQADVAYMAEWGLETHVEDLRRVIAQLSEADRPGHVYLMGHSLGGAFTEAYAAWRFDDGRRGVEDLAGLILIDGVLADAPLTEDEWHTGAGSGFTAVPGVDGIRADGGTRFFELPIFGVSIFARIEIMAMRALLDPDAIVDDPGRDDALAVAMALGNADVPPMTNAAALGWGFDDDSAGIPLASASMGDPAGGPLDTYDGVFSGTELTHPTSETATYTWVDLDADDADDFTPMADLAHAFTDGRTNFAEWYFPARLALDLQAVGGAAFDDGAWQLAEGLRARDTAAIDAPILCVAAAFVAPDGYEGLRARVAPAVGAGRPGAGATRDTDAGLRVVDATRFTHLEPLLAADGPSNPVPTAVLDFLAANTAAGTIAVPPAE